MNIGKFVRSTLGGGFSPPRVRTTTAVPKLELLVTLLPSFAHFTRFASDTRLAGIRLNSAQTSVAEIGQELESLNKAGSKVPLFFDVKGRQPRVLEVLDNPDYLEVRLNHPIEVATPVVVLLKAAADQGLLGTISEGGRRLLFSGNPRYRVRAGESLHIRDASFRILTPKSIFMDEEIKKIELMRKAGFRRYFLSYVEEQRDIEQLQELVGKDAEIWLKIENKRGLEFVATSFQKRDNLTLVAARGDLYVELDHPHDILPALRLIAGCDPRACVGSRMFLSVIPQLHLRNGDLWPPQVPECADFCELAWLYDLGYRRMLLCDELCLKENLLATAVNAFEAFQQSYVRSATLCTKTAPA